MNIVDAKAAAAGRNKKTTIYVSVQPDHFKAGYYSIKVLNPAA